MVFICGIIILIGILGAYAKWLMDKDDKDKK